MNKHSFTGDLQVNGSPVKVNAFSLNHSLDSIYPTLNFTINYLPDLKYPADFAANFNCSGTISVYDQSSGVGSGTKVYDKVIDLLLITNINNTETTEQEYCQISAAPGSYMASQVIGTYDGTGDTNNVLSAKYLAKNIIAACNSALSGTGVVLKDDPVFNTYDYLVTIAPRFLNVPFTEMLQQVAALRGLKVKIDFENRVSFVSYANFASSDVTIARDQISQSNVNTDLLYVRQGGI